jgi:RHS repeat-associated protein
MRQVEPQPVTRIDGMAAARHSSESVCPASLTSTCMQPMKTPGASESGTWQMKAEARSAGATVVESEKAFTVTVTPAATIQTFACDHASPQAAGSALRWTATATGGVPPLEYRFERQDGGTWSVVQPYSAAASYEWTPQAGDAGEHAVRVSVRSAGSTAAWEDQETLAMTIAPPNGAMQRRPDFLTALLAKVRLRLGSDGRHEPVSLSIGMEPLAGHAVAPLADHGVAPLAQAVEKHALYTPELNLMAEATDGVVEHEYVWFGGQPVAQFETSTGATHWYFDDHLGTPLLTTDATGAIDWQVEREPYGAVYAYRAGEFKHQPLRFPGQENARSSELSYNIFRWYRAGWGRYSSADPIGMQGGFNLFAYAYDNPVVYDDPLGLRVRMCCRVIPAFGLLGARHCFFQFENSRDNRPLGLHGTQSFGGYLRAIVGRDTGTVITNAPFDRGRQDDDVCGPWAEDPCNDVDGCVRKEGGDYPNPSRYSLLGPNSNTFAHQVARKCYVKPAHPVNAPGWNSPPAPPR